MIATTDLPTMLHRLVDGFTGLRHDGRFDEPNLDGTAGDYISFDGWEWPQGVGLFGLAKLWLATGNDDLRAVLERYYAGWLDRGLPARNVNTTAPLLALSILWRETRDPRWQPAMDDWATWLMRDAPRTQEGGFQHDVSDRINPGELWDDTLYMVGLFLASYGEASGRRDLVDEAERQFLVHARHLSDPQTGLWFHGWTFQGRHNFANARWARGNAWVTAGLVDLPDLCGLSPSVAAYLQDVLTTQIAALLPLQTEDGAWRTLLDDPSSYAESSATAGIAYGLMKAARLGLAGPEAAQAGRRGAAYVERQIDAQGIVGGVSYGTRMGHDLQFYRDIPIQPTGYGQALAILCLTEAMHT